MQIGIFSNGNRNNKVAKLSYDEDLHEIIVADRLGMKEAWISEHGTFLQSQAPDQLPCADLLICKAASLTRQIKMGPAIRPLPFFHPLQVAVNGSLIPARKPGSRRSLRIAAPVPPFGTQRAPYL